MYGFRHCPAGLVPVCGIFFLSLLLVECCECVFVRASAPQKVCICAPPSAHPQQALALLSVRACSWVAAAAHPSRVQGTLVACTRFPFEYPGASQPSPLLSLQSAPRSFSAPLRFGAREWPPQLRESLLRCARTQLQQQHRRLRTSLLAQRRSGEFPEVDCEIHCLRVFGACPRKNFEVLRLVWEISAPPTRF